MKMLRLILGLAIVLALLTSARGETPRHLGRVATVNGVLVRLDGRDLVVQVKQATGETKEITLPTDDNTEVRVDGEAGTVDDLRPDMFVQVTSAIRNVPGPARIIRATSKTLSGVVLRVEGRNLVIKTQSKDEREVTVETDGRTQILFSDGGAQKLATATVGRLEDVKAGMRVKVTPDSGTARKILVSGNGTAKKSGK